MITVTVSTDGRTSYSTGERECHRVSDIDYGRSTGGGSHEARSAQHVVLRLTREEAIALLDDIRHQISYHGERNRLDRD